MAGMMASSDFAPVLVYCAIVVVVGVVILTLVDRSRQKAQKAWTATLERIATRLDGTVNESEPSLQFEIEGRRARLEFCGGSRDSSAYSCVALDVRGVSPGQLRILKDGFGQRFAKLFGAQDLTVGDPSFDSDFVVKATPPAVAFQVFRPERRAEAVRAVRRIEGYENPTVDLDPQQLCVKVDQYFRDEADMMALIAAAREFAACVLASARPTGIVMGEVRVSTEGACPVCGTAMFSATVRCELCRTPHHSECWQYMGRCSTYACKGIRGSRDRVRS